MAFGPMGHATTGVVGAALATGKKSVAVVGDGAMLMSSEISTAKASGAPAVWVVLNDARYGMIDEGMRSLGWTPFATEIPEADFVAIARAVGADGTRVSRESELDDALRRALTAKSPFVVDVLMDRCERAPSGGRNRSLLRQVRAASGVDA
jgi:acetolactate synthase-1/2/3 large subunit